LKFLLQYDILKSHFLISFLEDPEGNNNEKKVFSFLKFTINEEKIVIVFGYACLLPLSFDCFCISYFLGISLKNIGCFGTGK